MAPETKPNQNQKQRQKQKQKQRQKQGKKRQQNYRKKMKKEEVIGKTIITITNNRDKDKTQPHNLQLTMTRLLVYLNDVKYYKLSCK